jgi:hypothetical protein
LYDCSKGISNKEDNLGENTVRVFGGGLYSFLEMLGALNEHPTDMGIAGFGEPALVARLPARRFHRDESQKAYHVAGMGELAEVSTF